MAKSWIINNITIPPEVLAEDTDLVFIPEIFQRGIVVTGLNTKFKMQRSSYAPPPANSPPLHHPVPQHVSTVPMMRSPPPPQSSNSYTSSPYGGQSSQPNQGGAGPYASAFGGFMNDPTTQMGLQLGQGAMKVGQEYMEHNVRSFMCPIVIHGANVSDEGWPICLRGLAQAVFRCDHPLCSPQAPHPTISLPTLAMVTITQSSLFALVPTIELAVRISKRGHQCSRHVHTTDGFCDLYPPIHAPRRSPRRVPP